MSRSRKEKKKKKEGVERERVREKKNNFLPEKHLTTELVFLYFYSVRSFN